jgi:hypothetical protein
MPPDLSKPYSSEAERAADIEALLAFWNLIETLRDLVEKPATTWTKPETDLFSRAGSIAGHHEHPQERLQRWVDIYSDEISIIGKIRNRLVHGQRNSIVTDPEIRGAAWLPEQVTSAAIGVPPSEMDPRWVKAFLAPPSQ